MLPYRFQGLHFRGSKPSSRNCQFRTAFTLGCVDKILTASWVTDSPLSVTTCLPVDAVVAEMSGCGLGALRALPVHPMLHILTTLTTLQEGGGGGREERKGEQEGGGRGREKGRTGGGGGKGGERKRGSERQ